MRLKNLTTKIVGQEFIYIESITSTQKNIWNRINEKTIIDGTVIFAETQTEGYGTHGRTWHTSDGKNLAFSIYKKINIELRRLDGITIKIAEIIKLILNKYGINIEIKSPNDLMLNNKKIGGILTEIRSLSGIPKHLVIGVGINCNKNTFENDIKDIATSIKKETGIEIDRFEFVAEFCNELEKEIEKRSIK